MKPQDIFIMALGALAAALDWLHEKIVTHQRQVMYAALGVGALLMLIGGGLWFAGWKSDQDVKRVEQQLLATSESITATRAYQAQYSKWFVPTAWQFPHLADASVEDLFALADTRLTEAQSLINQAREEPGTFEKIALANQALDLLQGNRSDSVASILATIEGKIESNLAAREEARERITALATALDTAGGVLFKAENRLAEEAPLYLGKYIVPIAGKIGDARDRSAGANQAIASALSVMPDDSDSRQIGNPAFAQEELDRAKISIDLVNSLAAQVHADLDYQALATTQAAGKTADALTQATIARGHIDSLVFVPGSRFTLALSMAQADSLQRQAVEYQTWAQEALTTPLPSEDGKFDLPAAYEIALASLRLSADAVNEADTQVANADLAAARIAQIGRDVTTINGDISTAESALGVLRTYHASSTWSGVSTNVDDARARINRALTAQSDAEYYASFAVQQFAQAASAAQSGLDELTGADNLLRAVVDKKNDLEHLRTSTWPSAESAAQSEISSQNTSYWECNSDAKRSYDSAVSELDRARTLANWDHKYQEAIDAANSARNLASGTESRAHSSCISQTQAAQQATEDEADRRLRETEAESYRQTEAARPTDPPPTEVPPSDYTDSGAFDTDESGSDTCSWGCDDAPEGGDSGAWEPKVNPERLRTLTPTPTSTPVPTGTPVP